MIESLLSYILVFLLGVICGMTLIIGFTIYHLMAYLGKKDVRELFQWVMTK